LNWSAFSCNAVKWLSAAAHARFVGIPAHHRWSHGGRLEKRKDMFTFCGRRVGVKHLPTRVLIAAMDRRAGT
jgi:hypothetical protein